MENQAAETSPARKSLFARLPKWLVIGVPVIALGAVVYQMAAHVGVEQAPVTARQAFASGNPQAAIEAYRAYIARHPADIAAHGELGNVLHGVGAMEEAAQAYFDAASLAIEQKQPQVAEALLPAIADGNPMLASELDHKLFEAQVRTHQAQPMPPAQAPRYQTYPQQLQQPMEPQQAPQQRS